MGSLGALCTILFFFFLDIGASKDDCPTSRCCPNSHEIRFPFPRSDHPEYCGYPGFELACQGNDTIIKLPSSGVFPIAHIDYAGQMLRLELKFCPASILLNLDVSNSPFRFYSYGLEGEPDNWTFLNCSTAYSITKTIIRLFNSRYVYVDYRYDEIDCLSESDNHIFAVPSSSSLVEIPKSCTPIKTIQVIRPYIFYLDDYTSAYDEYVPTLMWERPDCARCETGRGICRPNNSNSHEIMCLYQPECNGGICKKRLIIGAVVLGILVLSATTATTIKVCHSSLLRRENEKESQLKVEKFLEDYKALKPMRYSYADIKKITNQFKTKLGEGGYC